MADVAAKPKVKRVAKPKVPAAHPKYDSMIASAIAALKDRTGSSRMAIVKYIMSNFKVGSDGKAVNSRVKVALRNGLKKGSFKQTKGTGASGSFRIGEVKKAAKKPKSPKKAKSPKKKASPKKAAKKAAPAADGTAAAPKAKKATKPKSPKKAKSPKAKKPKSPKKAKSPAKPKAKKSPAKKVAKKAAPKKK